MEQRSAFRFSTIQAACLLSLAILATGCSKDGMSVNRGTKGVISFSLSVSDAPTKSNVQGPQATGNVIPVEIDGETYNMVEYVEPYEPELQSVETKGAILSTTSPFSLNVHAFADGDLSSDLSDEYKGKYKEFSNRYYFADQYQWNGKALSGPTHYWLSGVGLHFWSYAASGTGLTPSFSKYGNDFSFTWNTSGYSAAKDLPDVIIGYNHGDENSGVVNFTLSHPLCVVDFDFEDLLSKGISSIESVSLSGVVTSGTCTVSHDANGVKFGWSNLGSATATYEQVYSDTRDDEERHFIIIPQNSGDVKVKVSYVHDFPSSGTIEASFPKSISWETGMKYTYTLEKAPYYCIDCCAQSTDQIKKGGTLKISFHSFYYDGTTAKYGNKDVFDKEGPWKLQLKIKGKDTEFQPWTSGFDHWDDKGIYGFFSDFYEGIGGHGITTLEIKGTSNIETTYTVRVISKEDANVYHDFTFTQSAKSEYLWESPIPGGTQGHFDIPASSFADISAGGKIYIHVNIGLTWAWVQYCYGDWEKIYFPELNGSNAIDGGFTTGEQDLVYTVTDEILAKLKSKGLKFNCGNEFNVLSICIK